MDHTPTIDCSEHKALDLNEVALTQDDLLNLEDFDDSLLDYLENKHIEAAASFWRYHGEHGGFTKTRGEEVERVYHELADAVVAAEKKMYSRMVELATAARASKTPKMKRARRNSIM